MLQVPNVVAVFAGESSEPALRCEVFKTDGDLSEANRQDNRYVYVDGQLKLIAAVWDKKFAGFESAARK